MRTRRLGIAKNKNIVSLASNYRVLGSARSLYEGGKGCKCEGAREQHYSGLVGQGKRRIQQH